MGEMQEKRLRNVALTGVLVPGLMLGVAGAVGFNGLAGLATRTASAQSVLTSGVCNAFGAPAASSEMSVADVAEMANPAVVTIVNLQELGQADLRGFGGIDQIPGFPGIEDLPGIDEVPGADGVEGDVQAPEGVVPVGSGSGFIVDDAGHVVTNAHVVAGAKELQVVLADGSELDATVVGSESILDVALLQLDLPAGFDVPGTLSFGDSTSLRAGDEVVAIGNALGSFPNTVSEGTVNGTDRDFPGTGGLTTMIQHDAEIWHGNSGGPLLNLRGEVVGINTAGISDGMMGIDSGSADMAFAVESNTVCNAAAKLLQDGEIVWPYMGLQGEATSAGQSIIEVVENGPSDEAGIEAGDVITGLNGEAVDNQTSLIDLLFAHEPGDVVDVTVDRDGVAKTFQVTLGERPEITE